VLPITHRVRELMIAHAHPGLHQVCEQYLYLEEKRFEAWSAHLRRMLQPPTGATWSICIGRLIDPLAHVRRCPLTGH
jgi:hypothetical protein